MFSSRCAPPGAFEVDDLVANDDQAIRAWLTKKKFPNFRDKTSCIVGDSLAPGTGYTYAQMTPMARACELGQLNVCKFLHAHGAASDITIADQRERTPMHWACRNGHLLVCQWLFEVGAAADISKPFHDSKPDRHGYTPMHMASERGHLPVCQWLYKVASDEVLTKASTQGRTPMHLACKGGNLSVCQWLIEVCEAEEIAKADASGVTPMHWAYMYGNLSVCLLLALHGALNRPDDDDDDADEREDDLWNETECGHIDYNLVKRATYSHPIVLSRRPELIALAQHVYAVHHTFLHVVLRASVLLPASHQQVAQDKRCHLPRLPRAVLERLGSMLGVETGRRLRNVREFKDVLEEAIDNESSEEEDVCW